MTPAESLALLRQWHERMQDYEAAMDALQRLTGYAPESPLPAAISAVAGLLTTTVADRIGCSDEWLMVWWTECNLGERPLRAGPVGEELREITTIEELHALIVADGETS